MSGLDRYISGRTRNQEDAVMERYEARLSAERIATELDMSVVTVRSIINYLTPTLRDDWQSNARRGSAALLAAVERYQAKHGVAA